VIALAAFASSQTTPIAFGETFTMPSKVLGETRRIMSMSRRVR
jgi:hypothetical protein